MIHLDYRDPRPVYAQIVDSVIRQIQAGVLIPGEKLPSVRELAGQLAINPNTIQRAYTELEQEGYIYSIPGKGSFAAGDTGAGNRRRKELEAQLREVLRELKYLGVKPEECVVVGDTPADVFGGYAAGMKVIHIPDQVPANEETRARSWKVLEHIGQLPAALEEVL